MLRKSKRHESKVAKVGEDEGGSEEELDYHVVGMICEGIEENEVRGVDDESAQEEGGPKDQCLSNIIGLVNAHPLEARLKTLELIVSTEEAAYVQRATM
ncbi:hypothetical protein BHE74_00006923 [Ensete ventricosum]|nr:hypothetical protein GW17_00011034 [Ensete ventricosum]RWW84470.1 hypothetical protein BHE74_00006923 [Ensete ventricosum]